MLQHIIHSLCIFYSISLYGSFYLSYISTFSIIHFIGAFFAGNYILLSRTRTSCVIPSFHLALEPQAQTVCLILLMFTAVHYFISHSMLKMSWLIWVDVDHSFPTILDILDSAEVSNSLCVNFLFCPFFSDFYCSVLWFGNGQPWCHGQPWHHHGNIF